MRVPDGACVIDLGDATLVPNFIDERTHTVGRVLVDPEAESAIVKAYDSFGAILGVGNSKRTLMAGFTTIRNVGAECFDHLALKKAVDDGFVAGLRMLAWTTNSARSRQGKSPTSLKS